MIEKTIVCEFELKENFENGYKKQEKEFKLLEINGLGAYFISAIKESYGGKNDCIEAVNLHFVWCDALKSNREIAALVSEIKEGITYQLIITTDFIDKLSIYINGVHHLEPDLPMFKLNEIDIKEIWVAEECSNMKFSEKFFQKEQIPLLCGNFYHRNVQMLGVLREEQDYLNKMGELIYENPLHSIEEISDWVVDSGILNFESGSLSISSSDPNSVDVNRGHTTIWCDRVMPSSFLLEFDFKIIKKDLFIIFFAANGVKMDMFDPKMPKRQGEFFHYIKEAITSYHISYHATARGRSNCRKNNKFFLLGTGNYGANSEEAHHLILLKEEEHIRCYVDNHKIIDVFDKDSLRYGAAYGSGRIGLRQMKKGIGEYSNLKVYNIKK